MTRSAEVQLPFGDETRPFRLRLKQLRQLQERCADKILGERGPMTIMRDLMGGSYRVDDVYQTVLLGLIGGGMQEEQAAKLVKERFEDNIGLHQHVLTAWAILHAAMVGPEEDKIEPAKGAGPPGEGIRAESGSASPRSTDREPFSGGPPGTLSS